MFCLFILQGGGAQGFTVFDHKIEGPPPLRMFLTPSLKIFGGSGFFARFQLLYESQDCCHTPSQLNFGLIKQTLSFSPQDL